MNQRRYDQDKYSGDTPIVNESYLHWIDFPTISPMNYILSIKETHIEREDSIISSIESLTTKEGSAFVIETTKALMKISKP